MAGVVYWSVDRPASCEVFPRGEPSRSELVLLKAHLYIFRRTKRHATQTRGTCSWAIASCTLAAYTVRLPTCLLLALHRCLFLGRSG